MTGHTLTWLQNIAGPLLLSLAARDGLEGYVLRKRYLADKYAEWVVLGPPHATAAYSVDELIGRAIVGVYGWRAK
jgi:hypothetical protein